MLVLERRENETIIITLDSGERVEINVAQIENDRVKIGVSAPRRIAVHRGEVQKRIDEEKA